jgi:hypothetical protein
MPSGSTDQADPAIQLSPESRDCEFLMQLLKRGLDRINSPAYCAFCLKHVSPPVSMFSHLAQHSCKIAEYLTQ